MVDEEFYRAPQSLVSRHIPVEDVIVRHEKRIVAEKHLKAYRCPCTNCHEGHRQSLKTMNTHHEQNGQDKHLMFSMLGDDPPGGFSPEGIWLNDSVVSEPLENVFEGDDLESPSGDDMDPYHAVQQQIRDAFAQGDILREESTDAEVNDVQEEYAEDEVSGGLDLLDELTREATRPVYEGMNVTIVSATIVLINMAVIHSVPNEYLDELLKYLSAALLPRGNRLPRSYYEAKRLIRKLGLNYQQIHACPSGCVLFRKEHENLSSCPKPGCRKSRYLPNSKSSPVRVVRWFPIIPRYLRIPGYLKAFEIPSRRS